MKLVVVSVFMTLNVVFSLALSSTPTPPRWPDKWHSEYSITGTEESSDSAVRMISSGQFIYDFDPNTDSVRTASLLIDKLSGKKTLDIYFDGKFHYIDIGTGECSFFEVQGFGGPVRPDFLKHFSFSGIDYLFRDDAYFTTTKWTFDAFHAGVNNSFEYWHQRDGNVPFRFLGPSHTTQPYGHSLAEYSNVIFGLANVDLDFFFTIPENCKPIQMKDQISFKPQVRLEEADPAYPVWPTRFHCGLKTNGIDGDREFIPVSKIGHYFYDFDNSRTAEIMRDRIYGTKQKMIVPNDGKVYRISLTTGSCNVGKISEKYEMTGPVKPDWLKSFTFVGYDYRLRESVYWKTSKWVWKGVFPHSNDTEFPADYVYWHQVSTNTPFRILGPGTASPPYGHAFLDFFDFTHSLDDVNVDQVFSIPASCSQNTQEIMKA